MKEWVLAILKWSPKWRDSDTDIPGSAFYLVPMNESYTNKHGQELVIFHDNKEEDDDGDRPYLRFNGGKKTYAKLPPKAYININPAHTGSRLMTVEQYEKTSQRIKTATTKTSKKRAKA